VEKSYKVACTPRVRRGIDIDAGCGQLKSKVEKSKQKKHNDEVEETLGDDNQENSDTKSPLQQNQQQQQRLQQEDVAFLIDQDAIVMSDEEDWEDYEYSSGEMDEVSRLISLVKDTVITEENAVVGRPTSTSSTRDSKQQP
jgi:hypothetical protein